jgi:hypothetical protein
MHVGGKVCLCVCACVRVRVYESVCPSVWLMLPCGPVWLAMWVTTQVDLNCTRDAVFVSHKSGVHSRPSFTGQACRRVRKEIDDKGAAPKSTALGERYRSPRTMPFTVVDMAAR